MSKLSRRNFLKYLSQTSSAAALATITQPSFLMGQSASTGTDCNIVAINLNGGMDSLAALPLYSGSKMELINSRLRPSLAISPEQVLKVHSQIGVADKVGLHPEFAPLVNSGPPIAIVQGYGIYSATGEIERSHDTCQVQMSLGGSTATDPKMQGFLARVMDHQDWDSMQYWAFDVINSSDVNTLKNAPIQLNSIDEFRHAGTWWESEAQKEQSARLKRELLNIGTEPTLLAKKYREEGNLMYETVALVQSSIQNQIVGSNSAGDYTEDYGIGRQLRGIMKVIAAKATDNAVSFSGKNQLFCATHGGFDTHSDQANLSLENNGLGMRLRELATNLAVFYTDLKKVGMAEKTVIVLYSEFGRTAFQNAPAGRDTVGTDHGWGGGTIIIGGGLTSKVVGNAPDTADLLNQDFNAVRPTIDYRDIFAEIFSEKMGISPEIVFPDPNYRYQNYGILA